MIKLYNKLYRYGISMKVVPSTYALDCIHITFTKEGCWQRGFTCGLKFVNDGDLEKIISDRLDWYIKFFRVVPDFGKKEANDDK